MTGETDLSRLLASINPYLQPHVFVYLTFPDANYGELEHLDPIASMQESEGLTLVVRKDAADKNSMKYESEFRCISLQVHSSLDAVGLTAEVAGKLSDHGISANIIAGFFHDHIFVNANDADKALQALGELSASN